MKTKPPAHSNTGMQRTQFSTSSLRAVVAASPADALELQAAQPAGQALMDRLGLAPWWAVSVALHVLIVVLLGLITMSIGKLDELNSVVVLTSLEKAPSVKAEELKKTKTDLRDVLEMKETPATDPNSRQQSNIVVPPDILAKAELGDHFETINLDRPDTQSAFGNPDARMFHSVSGNDEPEGGGGLGGTSLMDDLIGAGGSASPGSGGGWGGGNGTGTGVGNGAGHGSFGSRTGGGRKLMVMKHGGSKATESTVEKGLSWLARHQEPNGSWDYVKYKGSRDLAEPNHHCAMTGLAVLAFLGAGHTSKVGTYKENVKRALEWLKSQQNDKGVFGQYGTQHYIYDQGICTLALAEAGAMSREKDWKDCAQKGIEYIQEYQNEYAGWRYNPKDGDSDTSVVGWMVMAGKSAKVAGLKVDPRIFDGSLNFVAKVTKTSGAGTDATTEVIYRPDEPQSAGFESDAHSTTAIGTLIRMYCGHKPSEDVIVGGCNYLLKKLPGWDKQHFYYWYYGTLCMFQQGGDAWKQWNEALKKTLLENQRKGGDEDGSWDPDHDYYGNGFGGRVYMTALGTLSLEVYYRYLPLYR